MRPTLLLTLAAGLAAFLTVSYLDRQATNATEGMVREADERARAHTDRVLLMHYQALAALKAGIVAGCMNGGLIAWTDPHTGASMGTFCDTQVLSKGKEPQ